MGFSYSGGIVPGCIPLLSSAPPLSDGSPNDGSTMLAMPPSAFAEMYWRIKTWKIASAVLNGDGGTAPYSGDPILDESGSITGWGPNKPVTADVEFTATDPVPFGRKNYYPYPDLPPAITDPSMLVCGSHAVSLSYPDSPYYPSETVDPSTNSITDPYSMGTVAGLTISWPDASQPWGNIYYDPNAEGGPMYYICPSFSFTAGLLGHGDGPGGSSQYRANCSIAGEEVSNGCYENGGCVEYDEDGNCIWCETDTQTTYWNLGEVGSFSVILRSGTYSCPIYGGFSNKFDLLGDCGICCPIVAANDDSSPALSCNVTLSYVENWP